MNINNGLKFGFIPESAIIVTAAALAGALAGLGSFFLHSWLGVLSRWLHTPLEISGFNYQFLLYVPVGIIGALMYQRFLGENLEGSTGIIKGVLKSGNLNLKDNYCYSPLLGCLMTVGMGGSAGAEGPCALSGAAMGGKVGRWFKLTPESRRLIFGCGAAAGIAGIFKSPVGGFFFAVEVLQLEMTVLGMMACITSTLMAFAVAYVLGGFQWNIEIMPDLQFVPDHFGWIALLGVVCGLYSIYYSKTQEWTGRFFRNIKARWISAAISGVGVGVVVFLLPAMFGEGYGLVSDVLNGIDKTLLAYAPYYEDADKIWVMFGIIGAMLLLKGAIVGAVNNGGGVAGEYVPTIFAGCLIGYVFATFCNMHGLDLPVENFALIATAAAMAGIIKAPLMSTFIAAEVSARYSFLLGFILASAISFSIVRFYNIMSNRKRGNGDVKGVAS
ncbi:MAG: chloride channel protein [Muribaculaceae bacterium]|nr:chloride channel protein [Muribaculaceae bacterium]